MYDKILAIAAMIIFLTFLGILGVWVEGWDIKLVLILTAAMATYDFWLDAFRNATGRNAPHKAPDQHDKQHDSI